jgi:hypothetical protein
MNDGSLILMPKNTKMTLRGLGTSDAPDYCTFCYNTKENTQHDEKK